MLLLEQQFSMLNDVIIEQEAKQQLVSDYWPYNHWIPQLFYVLW